MKRYVMRQPTGRGWLVALAVWSTTVVFAYADKDYHRLSELPGPLELAEEVTEWASPWCTAALEFRPDASSLAWPGRLKYVYLSPDSKHRVVVNPVLKHSFCWWDCTPEEACEKDPAVFMPAALKLIETRPQLSDRNWRRAAQPRPIFREVLPNGAIVESSLCSFFLGSTTQRLLLVSEKLRDCVGAQPALVELETALASVEDHMREYVGDRLVVVEPDAMLAPPHEDRCLILAHDDLQVSRLCYWIRAIVAGADESVTAEQYRRLQARWHDLSPAQRPLLHRPVLQVDAQTGELIEAFPTYGIPPADGPPAVELVIAGRTQWTLFPPRVVGANAYMCVQYLDSFLWAGAISKDGGRVTVELDGRTWRFDGHTGETYREGQLLADAPPVVEIMEHLYVPVATFTQVTGWQLEYNPEVPCVELSVPDVVMQRLERILSPEEGEEE